MPRSSLSLLIAVAAIAVLGCGGESLREYEGKGFTIEYPEKWEQSGDSDPASSFSAADAKDGPDAGRVRVWRLDETGSFAELKDEIRAILVADHQNILSERSIDVSGADEAYAFETTYVARRGSTTYPVQARQVLATTDEPGTAISAVVSVARGNADDVPTERILSSLHVDG